MMSAPQTLSLRANGSRECAPDDRLREAIQSPEYRLDCFVASAPRNDSAYRPVFTLVHNRLMTRCIAGSRAVITNSFLSVASSG